MIGEGTDYANLKMVDELNVEEYGVAFRKGSDVPPLWTPPLTSSSRWHHGRSGREIWSDSGGVKTERTFELMGVYLWL